MGNRFFTIHEIVKRLEGTRKVVVTNMEEIKRPELNALLANVQARGDVLPDLDERLIIIRKDETPEYYRYRSGHLVLPPVVERDEMGKRIKHGEFLRRRRTTLSRLLSGQSIKSASFISSMSRRIILVLGNGRRRGGRSIGT